jgi:hypothetical protein
MSRVYFKVVLHGKQIGNTAMKPPVQQSLAATPLGDLAYSALAGGGAH